MRHAQRIVVVQILLVAASRLQKRVLVVMLSLWRSDVRRAVAQALVYQHF